MWRPWLYDEAPWFEDGRPADLPEDFYSSGFLVDRMIEYLGDDPAAEGPVFAYVAFQAIHVPVRAPREFIERQNGVYDAGWDALDADERAVAIREMQANAGMRDAMDHHIGRLIDHLRRTGVHENTVFVVTSDNGPEGADATLGSGLEARVFDLWLRTHGYDETAVEALGGPGTWVAIGPEWASAAASPSDLLKFHGADGALRVPLILAGPGVPVGAKLDAFSIMPDVMPTLLDLVGIEVAGNAALYKCPTRWFATCRLSAMVPGWAPSASWFPGWSGSPGFAAIARRRHAVAMARPERRPGGAEALPARRSAGRPRPPL